MNPSDERINRLMATHGLTEDDVNPVLDSLSKAIEPWARALRKKHTEEYCLKLLVVCFGSLSIAAEGESESPMCPKCWALLDRKNEQWECPACGECVADSGDHPNAD
ncbi:MAG TPA: hypothetical protein VD994_12860 [Prosthecobacter sp.]|nr:hypothetical protein [Prosthecobacter sp.]